MELFAAICLEGLNGFFLCHSTMQLMGSRYSEARCRCYGNDSSPFIIESLAASCMYTERKVEDG